MSRDTLSDLKSEVGRETKYAHTVENDLKHLDHSIRNAMEDRVGCSARKSLASIRNCFSLHMDDGFQQVSKAIYALEKGYDSNDRLSAQSDALLAQANIIAKGLEAP